MKILSAVLFICVGIFLGTLFSALTAGEAVPMARHAVAEPAEEGVGPQGNAIAAR